MAVGRELPDDLIAGVLRRLPPRGLAVSRCVCTAWRGLVDARRLLRADLLPRTVGGIFLDYYAHNLPEFLSRPTTGPSISGDLEFIPDTCSVVVDHCNGLLLCSGGPDDDYSYDYYYVVNPATRRWARLPRHPTSRMGEAFGQMGCLAYDPAAAVSPHYEVFLIPFLPDDPESVLDPEMLQSEWPPSSYALQVFSSATGRWEEKVFVREGRPAGTIAEMKQTSRLRRWLAKHAVYWRGALYVPCENGFFMRMSISNAEYRLVPMPADIELKDHNGRLHLGVSQKGVYCAFSCEWHKHWIFLLTESCGQMVWEMKHHVDLRTFARKLDGRNGLQHKGPWILQDINYYNYPDGNDKHKEVVDDNYEWSSDDDSVLNTEDMVEGYCDGYTHFLGFHPYKEIVFLNASLTRAIAYHWNTARFQDLGNIFPKNYSDIAGQCVGIDRSFPYTPCWMEFPENKPQA
ncbi:unnamed protein product [Urochloa humidicola]